jgi:hypothetical protein
MTAKQIAYFAKNDKSFFGGAKGENRKSKAPSDFRFKFKREIVK